MTVLRSEGQDTKTNCHQYKNTKILKFLYQISGDIMFSKNLLLLLGIILITHTLQAQELEFMQPVGFQNPFLKSGQLISSLFYYERQAEIDFTNNDVHTGDKNFNFNGYLGLTDFLTLSTRVALYPDQKIQWETDGSTRKRKTDLHVNPEITLSYRPIEALEIFGTYNYRQYTTTQGAYSYMQEVPIDVDSTGTVIYEEREVHTEGMNPVDTRTYFFRFGLTYAGKLW